MERYVSVPMSLADACLVRIAELDSQVHILTLNGDFGIYRRDGRYPLRLLKPE